MGTALLVAIAVAAAVPLAKPPKTSPVDRATPDLSALRRVSPPIGPSVCCVIAYHWNHFFPARLSYRADRNPGSQDCGRRISRLIK